MRTPSDGASEDDELVLPAREAGDGERGIERRIVGRRLGPGGERGRRPLVERRQARFSSVVFDGLEPRFAHQTMDALLGKIMQVMHTADEIERPSNPPAGGAEDGFGRPMQQGVAGGNLEREDAARLQQRARLRETRARIRQVFQEVPHRHHIEALIASVALEAAGNRRNLVVPHQRFARRFVALQTVDREAMLLGEAEEHAQAGADIEQSLLSIRSGGEGTQALEPRTVPVTELGRNVCGSPGPESSPHQRIHVFSRHLA